MFSVGNKSRTGSINWALWSNYSKAKLKENMEVYLVLLLKCYRLLHLVLLATGNLIDNPACSVKVHVINIDVIVCC